MNASTVVLIVATAGLSGTSVALWQRLEVEREQRATMQARIAQLEQRKPATLSQVGVPEVAAPQPRATPQVNQQPKSGPRGPQLAAFGHMANGNFVIQRQRQMLDDPEYREAMHAQHRASMRQVYPDVATAMKLAPDQAERLFDLLADQQLRAMENPLPGPPPDTPEAEREWTRRIEEQQRQNEVELASVLGQQKVQAWKDYQMSLGARMQVRELRNVLADSAEPLRPDQIEPLVAALAQEETRFSDEMRKQFSQRPQSTDRLSLMRQGIEAQLRYNERRRDAATPYLSPAQKERFDEMIDQHVAMAKVQLKLAETQPEMSEPGVVMDPAAGLSSMPGFVPASP